MLHHMNMTYHATKYLTDVNCMQNVCNFGSNYSYFKSKYCFFEVMNLINKISNCFIPCDYFVAADHEQIRISQIW